MSLNWNVEKIEDSENVCFIRREPLPSESEHVGEDGKVRVMNPMTQTLIFATMSTKIGQITEKNAAEFYARIKVLEDLWGAFLYKTEDGEKVDQLITPEDVQAHIGLTCNVVTETRAQFKKVIDSQLDRHKSKFVREMNRVREEITA